MSDFVSEGYYRQIVELQSKVTALAAQNKELKDQLSAHLIPLRRIQIGDRVKANDRAGFHKGAVGVVQFVEPGYEKVWVLRDHSAGPVYYVPFELDVLVRVEDVAV